MQKLYFLLWLIICLISNSCYFDKELDNFVEVDPNPSLGSIPELSYSYDSRSYYPIRDTIWLMNSDRYFVRIESQKVYGHEVKVDGDSIGTEIRSGSSTSQIFVMDATSLKEGHHSIEITGIVKSGTGSLADVVEVEAAGYSYSFHLMVSNQQYIPEISSIDLTRDGLKIRWNEYPRSDFASYIIKKSEDFHFYHGDVFTEKVFSKASTSLIDPTFLGKRTYYQIIVDRGGSTFLIYYISI